MPQMIRDGSPSPSSQPADRSGRSLVCPANDGFREQRSHTMRADVARVVRAVRDSDDAVVDDAVTRLSRARPWLAPLTLAIGAFAMLFDGVKLVLTNWRLTLVQVLPAMWVWAAMYDLKLHVSPLHHKAFHTLTGLAVVIPLVVGVAAITAAACYLNAVFTYAIVNPGQPQIRPAFTRTRSHLGVVLGSGFAIGVCLGLSTVVAVRWGAFWFGLTLGAVIGVMMFSYVAVPSWLTGIKTTRSRRDKLAASVLGGTIGAVICTPPYILGRIGLFMLGLKALWPLGVVFFAVGLTLEAGATGAVKAVRMSAKFVSRRNPAVNEAPPGDKRHTADD